MTQLEQARNNQLTPLISSVAKDEQLKPALILKRIREGKIVIPANNNHKLKKPCAIGTGLRTKINANIGTSTDKCRIDYELRKLAIAVKYGADAVMDLSVGPRLKETRQAILERSPIPVGTVPIYEIAVRSQEKSGNFIDFSSKDVLAVLEAQAKQGVDFFTIHAGVTKESLRNLKSAPRLLGIVSRGGAIIANWVYRQKKENPFFEYFDQILEICREHDVTLSLGDGLRPGSVLDATDKAQLSELQTLGGLALRARKKGVQVMIEGPGHVPLDQIQKNVLLEKELCFGAPFYVLGPLVTDIAPGYDHIVGAIGGAVAASMGADFLCYLTPSEHLRLPSLEDVKEGVIASKIAAHAADIVKLGRKALERDKQMSLARSKRDWKKQIALSLDPEKARRYRNSSKPRLDDVCTMCGKYCSIKLMEDCSRV